ncbi:MAG TPA: hypothetical protein VIV12_11340, partial [Streptosporangiaceae bacterium]
MAKRPGPRRAHRPAPDAAWVFMLALLASVTLIALTLGGPRLPGSPGGLTGPWAGRITVPALVVEAIFAAALTLIIIRGRRAPPEPHPGMADSPPPDRAMVVARRLRAVLRQVLIVALVAIPALLLLNTLQTFTPNPRSRPLPTVPPYPLRPGTATPTGPARTLDLGGRSLEYILIALTLLALIVAGVIAVMHRRPAGPGASGDEPELPGQEDEEDLRDAVVAGRTALAALDDARAAVIACYLAME